MSDADDLQGFVERLLFERGRTPEDHPDEFVSTRGTGERWVRAMREMTRGYEEDPAEILARRFPATYDELILVRGVEFASLCEHHLFPFTGVAHVGYVPRENVVGLSKLARLVECFARRLQIQERLTTQVAESIDRELRPLGAAVVVEATHSCMGCRGVRKRAKMVTSALTGIFREDARARAEFFSMLRG